MPSSPRPRRSPLVSVLLCLALIAGFVLLVYFLLGPGRATDHTASLQSTPEPTAESGPSATPEPTSTPAPTILGETEDMGQAYLDRIVFLGDSITYQLATYGFVPFTHIWVPEIGTLSLFNWPAAFINFYPEEDPANPYELSIGDCAAARKPEYLVITLGLNGIALLDETQFKEYYRSLIQTILENSPDTKIICQSIFPVVDGVAPEGITNAGVDNGNRWILDVAEETGSRYLNTHDVLTDSTGGLVRDYSPWDGYHLTEQAQQLVLNYIRTHAWQ